MVESIYMTIYTLKHFLEIICSSLHVKFNTMKVCNKTHIVTYKLHIQYEYAFHTWPSNPGAAKIFGDFTFWIYSPTNHVQSVLYNWTKLTPGEIRVSTPILAAPVYKPLIYRKSPILQQSRTTCFITHRIFFLFLCTDETYTKVHLILYLHRET